MKEDDKVREEIEAATEVGAMQLESEAIRRAKVGVEEAVYYQGAVVGYETKYSDTLMTLLLKKRLKQVYGDEAATTNVNVQLQNAIQIMPRANTYEEWLACVKQSKTGGVLEGVATPIPVMLPAPTLDPAMADIL